MTCHRQPVDSGSTGPVTWQQLGADIDGEAVRNLERAFPSADGSTIAIGAHYNDDNGSYAGHVRIYQRNSDGNWEQLGLTSMEKPLTTTRMERPSPRTAAPCHWCPHNDGNGSMPAMCASISSIQTAIGNN